jgi:PAS domain S-box-containing protein
MGLAVGITAAVCAACAAGAYLYSIRHYQTLLETARGTALAQAELTRTALEHGMVTEDRTLIARMIRSFANEPGVAGVMLLDRNGVVQQSSGNVASGQELRLDGPTCQACHQFPPAERTSSRVLETRNGAVLRTVVPVANRRECHGCHDAAHKINGIVIFDMDAGAIQAAANRDLRWMVTGTAALALLLVGGIAFVVRIVILRRLQRFETAARQISEGRLDRRVPATGSDTISWLAREFNVMADSVTGLLGEVRNQRERLETVINSIDDGIVVLDRRRNVLAANDAFLARSGTARDRLLGCSCREAAGTMCTCGDCPTLACISTGERQVRVFQRTRNDGTVAWEEVHASPIEGRAGEEGQVVEVWRDITDRRAAEARLSESHRLASLGLLASGFSHEMNTPLQTILACVEGIARETQAADSPVTVRVRESAAIAREQIMRCRGITQHFLRMSRGHPSAGQIVDVHDAVTSVVSLIAPTAREHEVAIDVQTPGAERLRVLADEADLHHALMNLLLNAVQASRPRTVVSIDADQPEPGSVRVRVRDEGCGIAPEQLQRIFEPFVSLRSDGTGLGLFLALTFVRKWGGDIRVESGRGAGSVFAISLPTLAAGVSAVA